MDGHWGQHIRETVINMLQCLKEKKTHVVVYLLGPGIRKACTLVVVRNVAARATKLMSSFLSPYFSRDPGIMYGTLEVVRNVTARAPKLMPPFLSPISAGIRGSIYLSSSSQCCR